VFLFYWYQFTGQGVRVDPGHPIASAVDNGKLSFSLASVIGALANEQAYKDIAQSAYDIIIAQNTSGGWASLYDENKGLISAGFDNQGNRLGYWIDRRTNESRLAVTWAIMNSGGKVPITAFTKMAAPVTRQPYETIGGKKIEGPMTWDGAFFQLADNLLWVNEDELSPDYKNALIYFLAGAIDEDIGREGLPVLKSPCFDQK